jgi:hypothetical protein
VSLYKGKGPRSQCSNYRPISLLSVPGKVFAHVLLARLVPLLTRHRRPHQSGFTKGRSTMDAVLALRLLAELHREFGRPLRPRRTMEGYEVHRDSAFPTTSPPGPPLRHHISSARRQVHIRVLQDHIRCTSRLHTGSSTVLTCHRLDNVQMFQSDWHQGRKLLVH